MNKPTPQQALDALYSTVHKVSFSGPDHDTLTQYYQIVSAALQPPEPPKEE